jgi:hypothetical protein
MVLGHSLVVSRAVRGHRRSPLAVSNLAYTAAALVTAAVLLVLGSGTAAAQGNLPIPGRYLLTVDSTYQEGCFPPCACPISVEMPVQGTLALTPVTADPLYTTFRIDDVHWRISRGGEDTWVTGSGSYRVGGELAIMHQLTLDLELGDAPSMHFDSGLVQGGERLPDLDAVISMNGMVCYDRVLSVHARSLTEVVQHATFALVPGASSITLSLFTGGTSSPLYGTLRLEIAAPGGTGPGPDGLAVEVEGADLFAPALSPELPGMGGPLQLTLDQATRSVGAFDPASGAIAFDLHLVALSGNLPVPMPIDLRGSLEGRRLLLTGDNGDVPDGSIGLTIEAVRLTTRYSSSRTAATPD